MGIIKRTISFLTAVILLSLSFSSCANVSVSHENVADTDLNTEVEIPQAKEYDNTTTQYVKEKYKGIDYDGYAFTVISPDGGNMFSSCLGPEGNEFWYQEDSAEVQQHAVFTRNTLTEELLNCKISPTWGGDAYAMYDRARTIALSGTDDFDLMLTQHFRGLLSGTMGYFHDLYDIDSFDMDAYWWDQDFVDCYTYENHNLFSITGDALIFDDLSLNVTFYNAAMVENYNLEDPTVLVENGKWTAEKMIEMGSAVTADTNGDGLMDTEDTWGFLDGDGVIIIRMFDGFGIHIAEKDENDIPYLAADNDTFINAVQYIYDHIVMGGFVLSAKGDDCDDIFKDDRGLFMNSTLTLLFKLREMENDFGLLPLPKYNEYQKEYSSVLAPAVISTFSVPITVADTDKVGMFLNVLGGFSTDTVDMTLNEVILGAKLVRNKRTVEMLGYALDSKFYDWAKDIKWAFPIYQCMTDQASSKVFSFVSSIKRYTKQSKAMLTQLLKGYSFY